MDMFQPINDLDTEYSFEDRFSIKYFCPRNELNIELSLDWLMKETKVEWPLIFLCVGGGYLDYHSIFDFALDRYDDSGDCPEQSLALMSYEQHPDTLESDHMIDEIINGINLEIWALSFLKLFVLSIKWFCENINPKEDNYQQQLDSLCFDFCLVEIDAKDISLPYSSICNYTENVKAKNELRKNYEKMADKYIHFFNTVDPYSKEFAPFFDAVKTAWDRYGKQGGVPSNIYSIANLR